MSTSNIAPISASYFGMTLESLDYNFGYTGGPIEAWPTVPVGVVRSWDVWSPGNGQIGYLGWQNLNPAAGVYNWSTLDAWIAANQANNAQMVYTFGSPPTWAGGITTNLADFQAFVTAIVTQANGAIKYWEGFNEFDVSGISPALLVQLQAIIYNTVHTLDPGALVLSPTVSGAGSDPQFAQFLADGGGKYFDIAAFHGYDNSTGEGIIPVVQQFQATLAQYGLANVPIWDTEWGMEAPTTITDTTAQEAYVSTGLILQAALGVQTEMFYAYDNANSALYNSATGQLTPAGVAYKETEQWLTGATLPSGYQLNGSVYTAQLAKNGQTDLLVWNSAGPSTFSAGPYTEYLDAQGQLHAVTNGVVTIGTVPILLEAPSTPPAPAITSDTVKTGNTVTLAGSAEANDTITLYDGSTELGITTAGANGNWSYTSGPLSPGAQLITATATNIAGITGAPSAAIDPVIGPAVLSAAASGSGITNGSGDLNAGHVVTLTLTMSEPVTVTGGLPTLALNDGGTATFAGGSGSNSLTFTYTVVAGQNTPTLSVTGVDLNGATIADSAGNNATFGGSFSVAGVLQIDTTPPGAPTIVGDALNGINAVTLSGTAEANSTVTIYDGGVQVGAATTSANGGWTYTSSALASGTHVFTATATDGAGNISPASNAVYPIIGAFTQTLPRTLTIADGQTFDISGTVNNTGTIALNGNGHGADLAVAGSATLTGGGKVTLSNDGGNLISSNGAPAVLTSANNTIAGAGVIGDGNLALTNQGVINANQTKSLTVNTGSNVINNAGTMEATSTGGLYIDSNVNNTKTIEAYGTNATVTIESNVASNATGLILASGNGARVYLDNASVLGGVLRTSGSAALIATLTGTADALANTSIASGTTIAINPNSTLTLNGNIANAGIFLVNGGVFDVVGAMTGGVTQVGGAGSVVMTQGGAENVAFLAGSTGRLVLDRATAYAGSISGFGTTQTVDLADINFSTVQISYSPSNNKNMSGVLTLSDGTSTAKLNLAGTYTLANFKVTNDGSGGTLLTDPTVTQKSGNAAANIADNTVLEITAPDSGRVTFTGTSGTLWLDNPATFTGKVAGFAAQNIIDLPGIVFGGQTTLGYSTNSNNTGGTMVLSDGTHDARVALLGNYMASSFAMQSDKHGGTIVLAEVAQSGVQPQLVNPRHA